LATSPGTAGRTISVTGRKALAPICLTISISLLSGHPLDAGAETVSILHSSR
jgi:hypothetical protein